MSTIIDDHRNMLIFSGNISSWQLQNLQTWPYIVFDNIDTVHIEYNFKKWNEENGEADVGSGKVVFDIKFSEEPKEDDLEKRIEDLKFWTKAMFWQETEVLIKKDGEKWR